MLGKAYFASDVTQKNINTCLLYKLMCYDILDVTDSLYKKGSINNTRFLNSCILFPRANPPVLILGIQWDR